MDEKIVFSGRVGLVDVQDTVNKINKDIPEKLNISFSEIEELDVTAIQFIVALKEQYQENVNIEFENIDPNLQSLLAATGLYEIITDASK